MLPISEDMGFEGVAVLMSLMGVVGMVVSSFMLISLVKNAGSPVANAFVFFAAMIMVVLIIRSFLHAKAGFIGIGGADPHTFHDRAQSYYNFGVMSAMIAGGGLIVISFMTVFHPSQFLPIGVMVYLLLMSQRHRLAANIFGGFGVIATVILHWDIFKSFGAFGNALAEPV